MDHGGHGMMMDLPPFTLGRGLSWSADPFFLVACLVGLALYAWGVVRLRRRGDEWPVGRTVSYVVGVLSVMLVMCTGLNDYGMVMFSVHMVQHMVISMLSPILLLLGAPITLALRAMPPAGRGRKGPREWLLALLHSRYMRIITHPAFTIPLSTSSPPTVTSSAPPPGTGEPTASRPGTTSSPAASRPGADGSAASRPGTTSAPAASRPGADGPAASRPGTTSSPAASRPGADGSAASRPGTTSAPAASRPGADGSAASRPGTTTSAVASRPGTDGPGTSGPGTGGPSLASTFA
ncbi:hypothetical protein SCHAM137S_05682 [Streptomyces chartreusis]